MTKAPIPFVFFKDSHTGGAPKTEAWNALQDALGGGFATLDMITPERRSAWPNWRDFAPGLTPPADLEAARIAFDNLVSEWHFGFEELMNKHWGLCENPYAHLWLLPGMIVMHEDPLGWVIDTASQELADGEDYEEMPNWAIIKPLAGSNHEMLVSQADMVLPHAAILNAALTGAAREENHGDLGDLEWDPIPPLPGKTLIIGV